MEQSQLDFSNPSKGSSSSKSSESHERLNTLVALLKGRNWLTSRQIKQATHWDDRTIRQIAATSEGRILSGQKGYKLTREATPDERDHAVKWLRSQARKMIARSMQINRIHYAKESQPGSI